MIHEEYYKEEYFEQDYRDETDYRCTYERHWLDSTYYEDARFL